MGRIPAVINLTLFFMDNFTFTNYIFCQTEAAQLWLVRPLKMYYNKRGFLTTRKKQTAVEKLHCNGMHLLQKIKSRIEIQLAFKHYALNRVYLSKSSVLNWITTSRGHTSDIFDHTFYGHQCVTTDGRISRVLSFHNCDVSFNYQRLRSSSFFRHSFAQKINAACAMHCKY